MPGGGSPGSINSSPSCIINASPAQVLAGATTTLTWTCSNATSCNINGQAVNPNQGSLSVKPAATTIYVLSCRNPNGGNGNPQITVSVTQNPYLREIAPP